MVFKLPDPKMIKFKIKKGSDQHFSTVNLDSVKDIVDNFLQERISYIITSQSTDNFGLPSNYFSFYQTILSTLYNTTLLNCNMTFGILGSEWFEKDKKECVFKNLCEFKEHFGVVNKKEGFLMFAILFDRHTSIMVLDLKENKLYLFDSSWYHQQKLNSPFPNIPVNEITLINEVPLQKHPYGTCFYFGLAFIEELLQINDEEILRKKLKFRNTRAELSLKTAIRTSCFIDKYLNGGIQDQEKPEIIINPQEQISYLSSDYITITCGDNKVLLRRDQSQKTCVEKTYILVLAYVTYKQYHLADFYYSSKSQAMRILRDQSTDSESISLEKEEACCKCKSCC